MRHSLAESPLFSDEALVRLIEATPRENYHVNTMPRDASDPHLWREGDMSGLSGREVMAAVERGELWVHLQRVQEADAAYRDLLDAAFDELSRRVPGFNTFQRSMSVLISSPPFWPASSRPAAPTDESARGGSPVASKAMSRFCRAARSRISS